MFRRPGRSRSLRAAVLRLRPEERRHQLSEVVVTASPATEQIKLPFTVTGRHEPQMPVAGSNPLTQLQGKIPGAMIVSASGRPGAAPSVVLRGPVSLNATGRSQQPLYLLDGVPLQGGLPDINPNDIENVEVVKGAAAASLYGARAAPASSTSRPRAGKNCSAGRAVRRSNRAWCRRHRRRVPACHPHVSATDPTGQHFCTTEVVGGSPCGRYIDWDQEVQRINNSGEDFSLPPQKFLRDFGIVGAPNYAQLTGLYLSHAVAAPSRSRRPGSDVRRGTRTRTLDMRGKVGNTGVYASRLELRAGRARSVPARIHAQLRPRERGSAIRRSHQRQRQLVLQSDHRSRLELR